MNRSLIPLLIGVILLIVTNQLVIGQETEQQEKKQQDNESPVDSRVEPAPTQSEPQPQPQSHPQPQPQNESSSPDQPEEDLVSKLPNDISEGFSCHMRTIDLCVAGALVRGGQSPMPTSEHQLDVMCRESKITQNCFMAYNQRCGSARAFGFGMPMSALGFAKDRQMPFCPDSNLGFNSNQTQAFRAAILKSAPCINERFGDLRKCFKDLQTVISIFFDPKKPIPTEPMCCALNRFRRCANDTLKDVCGFGSYSQLEKMVFDNLIPINALRATCRRVIDEPKICDTLLPPPGTPVPQRRGKNGSKLARILALASSAA